MRILITIVSAALLAAACQSAPADKAEAKKPDPRQGKEVSQICFQSQIRSWKELDRTSVIVEKGVKEEFKLDLIGTCDPGDAFTTIGLISRGGGSCLSRGDQLVTDARYNDGACSIRSIYEWNSKLKAEAATDAK